MLFSEWNGRSFFDMTTHCRKGARLCALLLALSLVPLGTAAVRTAPLEETVPVEISAPSALLVEAETGTVIFEKNADEQRPWPA